MPTTFTPTDISYDYAIGGLPFLSAASPELPHRRETAPYRKDQFDQSSEPGEQSLSFWWTRSQSSFHGGAGQNFLDGGDTNPFRKLRFDYSRGLDVWTDGELKLLPAMTTANTDTGDMYCVVPCASPNGGVFFTGTHTGTFGLWHRTDGGVFTQVTGYTGGLDSHFTTDGTWLYFSTSTGVWRTGAVSPGAVTHMYTSSYLTLHYAKNRLIAFSVNKVYELDTLATGPAVLPTAVYTHPNTSLYFQSAAEGPTGIYLGATADGVSTLFLAALDTSGAVPVLGVPTPVLTLPLRESLWSSQYALYSYVGKFLCIATNLGVRVAKIDTDGSLDMGPLILQKHDDADEFYFGGFAAYDRFIYAVCQGVSPSQLGASLMEPCAFRLDLSMEIAEGRYAWAMDQATGDSAPMYATSCCIDRLDKLYIAGDSSPTCNLYRTATTYVTSGYLVTSRIRFSTGDDKVFERLLISGDGDAGSMTAKPLFNGSLGTTFPTLTLTGPLDRAEARIEDAFAGKQTGFIQVRLDFTPTGVLAEDAAMRCRGYVLKALPAQERQRVEQIPVLLYDSEKDRSGQLTGSTGSAYSRLEALEALESAGSVVTLQRFGPNFSSSDDRLCVVDRVEFVRTTRPTDQGSGWGGVVMITVRMVD